MNKGRTVSSGFAQGQYKKFLKHHVVNSKNNKVDLALQRQIAVIFIKRPRLL